MTSREVQICFRQERAAREFYEQLNHLQNVVHAHARPAFLGIIRLENVIYCSIGSYSNPEAAKTWAEKIRREQPPGLAWIKITD